MKAVNRGRQHLTVTVIHGARASAAFVRLSDAAIVKCINTSQWIKVIKLKLENVSLPDEPKNDVIFLAARVCFFFFRYRKTPCSRICGQEQEATNLTPGDFSIRLL